MVPGALKHIDKIDDLKLFECAGSLVTRSTWQIINLVGEITDQDGRQTHYPLGNVLEQPGWLREAVRMMRTEKNSDWYRREAKEAAKRKAQSER
jgi:hypothetical protein